MRTLNRNKRPFWYANFVGKIPFKDEYGNSTTEFEAIYSDPEHTTANISPARGESSTRQFGETLDYDKVIVFAGKSPVTETSILWIDNLVTGEIPQDAPHDYVVMKVAESLNSTSLAVRKVTVSLSAYQAPTPNNTWDDAETWHDFEIWRD